MEEQENVNQEINATPIKKFPFSNKRGEKKVSSLNKGKEIKVDTHLKEKLAKKRKEEKIKKAKEKKREQFLKETKERKQKFISEVIKEANKQNKNQKIKNKETKVKSNGTKEAELRKQRALKTPFSYYYNACRDVSGNIAYCNVSQCMNDKYIGRIYQPQYFAIAEQSDRIFKINGILIKHAIATAILNPEINFAVQVSPKYFTKKETFEELSLMLENVPSNLILAFDAREIVISGNAGKKALDYIIEQYHLKIMLDNPETERMSMLFEYPLSFLRLDGRYYAQKDDKKTGFVKLMNEFCKSQNITLCAKNVETKEDRSWLIANGVRFLEGKYIQPLKTNVKAVLK